MNEVEALEKVMEFFLAVSHRTLTPVRFETRKTIEGKEIDVLAETPEFVIYVEVKKRRKRS